MKLLNIGLSLGTLKARLAMGAAIVLALCGLRLWDVNRQREIGAWKVVEASKKEGAKANAKNEAVRARADVPDAADRLRKQSCRDCR